MASLGKSSWSVEIFALCRCSIGLFLKKVFAFFVQVFFIADEVGEEDSAVSADGGERDGSCLQDFYQGWTGNVEVIGSLLSSELSVGGDDGDGFVMA